MSAVVLLSYAAAALAELTSAGERATVSVPSFRA